MKRLFWILCAGGLLCAGLPAGTAAQDMDVGDFVHQIYVEGIPYEAANAYGADAVPTLLAMLADTSEAPYWANVAVTLCIIGDESALDSLIGFIESDAPGELSDAVYRAKSSAVMALGYLINKTGNERALNYLVESAQPANWEAKNLTWRGPFQPNMDTRNVNLSTMAMLGLALSGRPEAAEALRTLSPDNFPRDFQPQVSGLIEVALEAHQQIAEQGLATYYQNQRAGFGN